MRSDDGQQTCEQCSGQGCYHCDRRGYTVQCPGCANDSLDTISKSEDEFRCGLCGTVFGKSGDITDRKDPTMFSGPAG